MTMPAAVLGSITTGHGCWPPTLIAACNTSVISDAGCISQVTNAAVPHICVSSPNPAHPAVIAIGSSTVIIEGLSAARIGDPLTCGDIIATGSSSVIIG